MEAPGPIVLVNSFASGGASVQRRAARRRIIGSADLQVRPSYVLNAKGEYAGVAKYAAKYPACTETGAPTLDCEALHPGRAMEGCEDVEDSALDAVRAYRRNSDVAHPGRLLIELFGWV